MYNVRVIDRAKEQVILEANAISEELVKAFIEKIRDLRSYY